MGHVTLEHKGHILVILFPATSLVQYMSFPSFISPKVLLTVALSEKQTNKQKFYFCIFSAHLDAMHQGRGCHGLGSHPHGAELLLQNQLRSVRVRCLLSMLCVGLTSWPGGLKETNFSQQYIFHSLSPLTPSGFYFLWSVFPLSSWLLSLCLFVVMVPTFASLCLPSFPSTSNLSICL